MLLGLRVNNSEEGSSSFQEGIHSEEHRMGKLGGFLFFLPRLASSSWFLRIAKMEEQVPALQPGLGNAFGVSTT